jgi:hypothetical protein
MQRGWSAAVVTDGETVEVGAFNSLAEAAIAHDAEALQAFGTAARTHERYTFELQVDGPRKKLKCIDRCGTVCVSVCMLAYSTLYVLHTQVRA